MIFDLGDRRERNFYDLAIRDLDLDAWRGERLGCLHAPHCATHTPAIGRNDLYIVLAIEWLQRCECLGYFHSGILPFR